MLWKIYVCMRPNIGPAAAGPAGPVATALIGDSVFMNAG